MSPFQVIALAALVGLCIWELAQVIRADRDRRLHAARLLLWLAAAVAISSPDSLTGLAQTVGIHRGADLLLYMLALGYLAVSLYFYSRYVRQQQQITALVRHLAIREARRGNEPDDGPG
jgi:hypothetical protein